MLLETFLTWNSVISSVQCEIMGYQNSDKRWSYSDGAKIMSKLMISGDWV